MEDQTVEQAVEERHVMRAMGPEGDTKVVWDPDVPVEVEAARATFNKLRAKRYNAYAVKKDGEPGALITEFDPNAAKIILAPPMAGG